MERKRRAAQVSIGDFGRFFSGTRRGRILVSVLLAAAVLLGVVLGLLRVSDTVMAVALFVFAAIAVPIILLRAIKAIRPPQDRPQ